MWRRKQMKINRIILAALFILFINGGLSAQPAVTGWPEPAIEAKPWVRWWWMGSAVNEKDLKSNLDELSRAGLGGVEITPIYGVKGEEIHYLDYLSPEWMKMLAYTQSTAKGIGMSVDMTMGTGWPFGGPDVSLEDAATKAIFQTYSVPGGKMAAEKIVVSDAKQKSVAYLDCLMAYAPDGKRLELTQKVKADGSLDWIAPKGGTWNLVALFVGKTFQQVKRAAPGGQGYVLNHLDKEAVSRYFARFDSAFTASGTPYPHSFFNDSYEVYGADWTPDLLSEFERRCGYQLQDYFPDFLSDGKTEQSARIISDYRETVGGLLKENFTEHWTNWAHERGITTRNQAHGSPANLIDIYAAVDIPECETFGITDFDLPGLRKDSIRKENDGDPTTLKYASSAAHIAGKKLTSAETFTWLTEHFRTSLSQCKPEIDQMFVSGVNHVYFHGTTYSPETAAWPGWKFYAAVDMSPTNSIWRNAPAFFNYVQRVQSFLQEGMPDNDFLLYLPIYDIWAEQRGNNFLTFAIHGMRERLPEFYEIVGKVRESGYDLDYISDHFLQTTTVEDGLLKTEGGATYKALILPAVKRMSLETLQRIRQLAEHGATLIIVSQYPQDVPGFSDLKRRQELFKTSLQNFPNITTFQQTATYLFGKGKVIAGHDYNELLTASGVTPEVFKSRLGGDYIRRKAGSGYIYFLTLLQNRPIDGWIPLGVEAQQAMLYNPMTGESGQASVRRSNGSTEAYLQLKPGESLILKTFDEELCDVKPWAYYQENTNQTELQSGWKMRFTESFPSVFTQFELDKLGSWTLLPNDTLTRNMGTACYQTDFDFIPRPDKEYSLSLGDIREGARVYVNGEEVATLFAVPFECRIGKYLKPGKNRLEVEVTNLPANRIADYDRRNVNWRIFHEINFVSITYKDVRFDTWKPVPSGLVGPVVIKELNPLKP